MKKSIFTLFVALCTSLFALTSCEGEPEPADLIVGHWMLSGVNMQTEGVSMDFSPSQLGMWCEFCFVSDGSFRANIYEDENGETGETLVGTYSLLSNDKESVLNITVEGELSSIKLVHLDNSSLILQNTMQEDGVVAEVTLTFQRGRMHMLA